FQPGQFKFFLPQNFIHIFHAWAPVGWNKGSSAEYGSTGNLSRKTAPASARVVIETRYLNTTTATRMPRIRTITVNRLTWFASHESDTGAAFARKAGTNSSATGAAEADDA